MSKATPKIDFNDQEFQNFKYVIRKVWPRLSWSKIEEKCLELEKTGQCKLGDKIWKIEKRKNCVRTNGGFKNKFILQEVSNA